MSLIQRGLLLFVMLQCVGVAAAHADFVTLWMSPLAAAARPLSACSLPSRRRRGDAG